MAASTVRCAGLLFDMDGVLADSLGSVRRSWRRWAAEYSVADAATLDIPHGTRAVDIIRLLRPDLDEAAVRVALRRIDEMELADLDGVVALPGAAELLRSLPPDRWVIVTSARKELVVARLGAAGLAVPDRLVTADDVREGKPHPEPYLKGAAVLGVAAADCIVLEDAPGGVKAGKAAGCRVIGVVSSHEAGQLWEVGADWVVHSMQGIAARLVDGGLELIVENIGR